MEYKHPDGVHIHTDSAEEVHAFIRPGPALFVLVVLAGIVCSVAFVFVPYMPWLRPLRFDNLIVTLNWIAYVASVGIVLTLASGMVFALWDMLFARRLFFIPLAGKFIEFGFPQFGRSLIRLRDWNDPAKADTLRRKYEEEYLVDDLRGKPPFSRWMIAEIIRKYENAVQGLAYAGAAVLIFIIGLRGLQIITKDDPMLIIWALLLEFALIGLLGIVIFFKPEEHKPHLQGTASESVWVGEFQRQLNAHQESVESMRGDLDAQLRAHEQAIEELRRLLSRGKSN